MPSLLGILQAISGFSEYLRASGTLMKPIAPQKMREEPENLRHPLPVSSAGKRVRFHIILGESKS